MLITSASIFGAQLPNYQLLYANYPGEFILRDFRFQRSVTLNYSEQDIPLDFRWSPDGRSILYMTITDGLYAYQIYDLFERRVTRLDIESTGVLPSWSPDSQQLTYGSLDGVCTLTMTTLNHSCMGMPQALFPAWSPDGDRIAYYSDSSMTLQLLDIETGQDTRVLKVANVLTLGPFLWSPDSRSLIYHQWATVQSDDFRDNLYLLTFNPNEDGTWQANEAVNLTSQQLEANGSALGYRWSPDGQQFAYTAYIRALQGIGQNAVYDLFLYDPSNNTHRRLTDDEPEELDPAWSSDGRWFAYISSLGRSPTLVLRDAAADYAVIYSARISSYNLDWRP